MHIYELLTLIARFNISNLHCLQLTEEDELRWDDGTANPEYCIDQFNLVGKVSGLLLPVPLQRSPVFTYASLAVMVTESLALQWEAVGMLAAGFGVFGLVAGAAKWNNKASSVPFVSCTSTPMQFIQSCWAF